LPKQAATDLGSFYLECVMSVSSRLLALVAAVALTATTFVVPAFAANPATPAHESAISLIVG
jgi:hypothetical protein